MSRSKKKTSHRKRYKSLTFKLSYRQFQSLKNYGKIHEKTPLKVIKDRIRECTEDYSDIFIDKDKIAKNQLDLFDPFKSEEQQLGLFD